MSRGAHLGIRFAAAMAAALVPGAAAAVILSLPAVQATHVRSGASGGDEIGAYDLNFGGEAEISASAVCGAGGCFVDELALLQWDLAAIPPGAQILDVALELTLTAFDTDFTQELILLSPDGSGGVPANSEAWDEDTVTALSSEWVSEELLPVTLPFGWVLLWDQGTNVPGPGPGNTTPGPGGFTTYVISDADASGGLAAAVALWLADPASNHGLSLAIEGLGEPGQWIRFTSDETAYAPMLRVSYVPEPVPSALVAAGLVAVAIGRMGGSRVEPRSRVLGQRRAPL